MCRDGIPPKNCAAVIILALSSSGAKRKYFLTSAKGLLRNATLQFHSKGWITIPGFPSKKKMEFDRLVLSPPALPLYRGRDISMVKKRCSKPGQDFPRNRCAGVSSTMVVRWSPFQKVQPLEGHHAKGALTGQPKHSIMS